MAKADDRAWLGDVGTREVFWLLESFGSDRCLADNEDLLKLVVRSMSKGHRRRMRELLERRKISRAS